jgi:hypothetical protein
VEVETLVSDRKQALCVLGVIAALVFTAIAGAHGIPVAELGGLFCLVLTAAIGVFWLVKAVVASVYALITGFFPGWW